MTAGAIAWTCWAAWLVWACFTITLRNIACDRLDYEEDAVPDERNFILARIVLAAGFVGCVAVTATACGA